MSVAGQDAPSAWTLEQPLVVGRIEIFQGQPATTVSGDHLSAYLDEETKGFRVLPLAGGDGEDPLAVYLRRSPEIRQALAWLRTAREIAWRYADRPEFWRDRPQTAALEPLLRKALAARLTEPLVVVREGPGSLCALLHPAVLYEKAGDSYGRTLHSLIVVKDGGPVTVADGMTSDFLDLIVAHEIGHVIMHSLMGRFMVRLNERRLPHSTGLPTDPGLALMEGWAEAFEALLGKTARGADDRPLRPGDLPKGIVSRQDPVRRERYIWVGQTRETAGRLVTGSEMMALEGVIAGLFYDLLSSRAIAAPFDKCCEVFALDRPVSFPDFARAFLRRFPEDRRVFCRILLENTHGAVMSREAGSLYQPQYLAGKAAKTGRGDKTAATAARQAWRTFMEKLTAEAVAGADPFANVGEPVWLSKWGSMVDLNSANRDQLIAFGLAAAVADRIIAERGRIGFFTGNASKIVADLSAGLPPAAMPPSPPPYE